MNKKISFWLIGYSILVLMIGTNIPSPLYSVYKDRFGFSSLILTLLFASYALVLVPSLAIFGRLSDKLGRKRVVWCGIVVAVIGSVLFAYANSIAVLFIARILQGLSVGLLSGSATAALIELNPYSDGKTASLVASIATAGGTALGPLVGGVIAQYGPYPVTTPFLVHVILAIPCVIGILYVKETVENRGSKGAIRDKENMSQQTKRLFTLGAITAFIAWSVTALFMSIIPTYVSTLLQIKNMVLTGGVVFVMLGSSVVVQFVLRKLPYIRSMSCGLIFLIIGLAGIVCAVPMHSVLLMLLGTVAVGVGQGLAFKGSMELVQLIAPASQKASIVSKLYVVIYLGVGLPIIGVGTLAVNFGLYNSIVSFAFLVSAVSLILLVYTRKSDSTVRLSIN